MGTDFDRYFGKVMPLVAAIAMMKTFLSEEIAKEVIAQIQRAENKTLSKDGKRILQRAADAAVAKLNPDFFNIDATWAPKSVEEVKMKLVDLKLDRRFKQSLLDEVVRVFHEPQSRIHEYK